MLRGRCVINAYQRVAGEAIFEIGYRLKHVKENDLVHGEYEAWLRTIDMNKQQAHRFVKVYEEFGEGKVTTSLHSGLNALYEIAQIPPEQRTQPHTIPSTGETKTGDEMTVRELREVKKALKEAEERAKQAEQQAEIARRSEQIAIKRAESFSHYRCAMRYVIGISPQVDI